MVATPPSFNLFHILGVPEPRIELGAALQQHDALPVGSFYSAHLIVHLFVLWQLLKLAFFIVHRELKSCKSKMDSQSKQVAEYSSRLDEYDKKFEENSRKFGTLLTVIFMFV